jgi:hypothetical protein
MNGEIEVTSTSQIVERQESEWSLSDSFDHEVIHPVIKWFMRSSTDLLDQ